MTHSDGGNATISFDNGPEHLVNYYNSTPDDGHIVPSIRFKATTLTPIQHTIRIKNVFDANGTINGGYGRLNVRLLLLVTAYYCLVDY